ncbi:hypothetical protein [Arcanobacterium bovis]|uniref:Uncharacterized protein n=1 Tax=Arcanobacterium bovis TaxID=2529275 RepID=A0A4V2KRC2_9ACTO|nr:hypothetical protein [Arcanobacterium bovis]TBW23684.1 hypothetical protein EZJ44_00640 [Arcanobacterium bovis]
MNSFSSRRRERFIVGDVSIHDDPPASLMYFSYGLAPVVLCLLPVAVRLFCAPENYVRTLMILIPVLSFMLSFVNAMLAGTSLQFLLYPAVVLR